MLDMLGVLGKILFALIVGYVILNAFFWFVLGIGRGDAKKARRQSEIRTRQMTRNARLIRMIEDVRELDNTPDGRFSSKKMAAWKKYEQANAQDAELTKQEIKELIEL